MADDKIPYITSDDFNEENIKCTKDGVLHAGAMNFSLLFDSNRKNADENIDDLYNDKDNVPENKKEDRKKEKEDDQTIKNKKDKFEETLEASYTEMDNAFLYYLKDFNENTSRANNQKILLKCHFFYVTMLIMLLLCVSPYVVVICFHKLITETTITILSLSSLAEIISAIIVLPKIIAKYLFNKNEEAAKIELIKNMQSYNTGKRL